MKLSRRSFLSAGLRLLPVNLLIGLFRPGRSFGKAKQNYLPKTPGEAALNFIVFGDWGREGKYHQADVAGQMARVAAERRCRLIVSVGDNFYEDGVASVTDPHWQSSFENVYRAASLQVPWYVILGNHDYRGEPAAQLEYSKMHPRWRMPSRYYNATERLASGKTVEFFFLDTSPFVEEYRHDPGYQLQVSKEDTQPQLDWLDNALGASRADWKIVIGHHPIFSGGEHGDTRELVRDVNPLLKKHEVLVYLNGHDHDLQHIDRDRINYFTSGAGSKIRLPGAITGTIFDRGTPGFMAVGLDAEKMHVEFIDYLGKSLYRTEVRNHVRATAGA
jgi:tartrate-resistant acid phosphatase type 5